MRRIEKRDYEHDGAGWKVLVTTKYLYDGWDIVAAYVTTGNATTAHAYLYGADLSGTLGGAGGIGGLVAELQFTNYNLQFGAGTVAAIGDRGNVAAAAAVECGSAAAALSEGAQLPSPAATVAAIADRGKVAAASCRLRSQDGSSTVEAASCRLRSQDGSSTLSVHFYIANHRGDTVLVIGESGAAESHLQYDAFGNVVAKSGSFTPSYTFSTKEHLPGANLYAYAYRVYDPIDGRWTQRDPIDYQDSVNLGDGARAVFAGTAG